MMSWLAASDAMLGFGDGHSGSNGIKRRQSIVEQFTVDSFEQSRSAARRAADAEALEQRALDLS